MDNESYVARLGILYDRIMKLRDDKDFVINQIQMDKFVKIVEFFVDECERQEGTLSPVLLTPKEEHGGLTASFLVFDIYGENIQRFCSIMSACSAISIDATVDGEICISCTVPNVFVHKDSKSE